MAPNSRQVGLLKKKRRSSLVEEQPKVDIVEEEPEKETESDDDEVEDEEPEDEEEVEEPMEVEKPQTSSEDPEMKQNKSGVVYFPMIPPKYTVKRLREYFEKIAPGEIGRIYLAKSKHSKSADTRYGEGWMELKKKKIAKAIAAQVDNTPIGGKQKDYVSSMFWNIRYLSGFKWVHLMEQLQFEKQVEKRRMNVEIAQARRIATHFEESIEKGKHLRKLEAKVKEAGGKWSTFNREVQQKKELGRGRRAKKERGKTVNTDTSELMNMIFK